MLRAFLALGAFACAALLAPAARSAEPVKPNLLLLVAEDLGPRIGAFGDPVARTPNLDRLAAEGVRFPNTFTTSGVCAPSRAALITGVHQIAMGGQHMRTGSAPGGGYLAVPPPDVKAFPELLRAAGYYTFVTEKLDYQFSEHGTGTGPFTVWDAEDDDALWRGRAQGQPFFGMLNFLETHESGLFRPLGSWPHSFLHFLVQLFRWWRFGLPGGDSPTPLAAVSVPAYYPDVPAVREDIARHYDNIAQMDAAVGRVLERLETDGLADSTIVIFTTDHGDGLPRAKRELYDSGICVPLIVRWPAALRPRGMTPAGVEEQLVSFVDLAPTLLALAGVEAPGWLQGRDFLAAGSAPRTYVHAARDRIDEVADRQRLVRDARFAYIRSWRPGLVGAHALAFRDNLESVRALRELYRAGRLDADQRRWFEAVGEERLFDTRSDPDELHDLSKDPAHADILARMRRELETWLAQAGDWSVESEAQMVARFRPGGVEPVTPAPILHFDDGRVSLESSLPGVSLGYRIDTGRWLIYTHPFEAPPGARVEAKAVRYGWAESDVVAGVGN